MYYRNANINTKCKLQMKRSEKRNIGYAKLCMNLVHYH